jgi:hypothetical protein
MRAMRFLIVAIVVAGGWCSAHADDYVYADSFETILCSGVGCTYCNPTNPLPGCGGDSHCLPQPDGASMCSYPAGSGTQGAQCSSNADCAGPFACIQGVNLACRQWCTRPVGSCPAGATCVSLAQPLLIGAQEWGVCL